MVCVHLPLTLDQARLWATMVGLTGQLFMASDKMYELPPERVEILRRVFPVAKLMPMDLYPLSEAQMNTLNVKVVRPFGSWDVVGLFNWSEIPKYVHISQKSLSLPENEQGYHIYDFWNKQYLGVMHDDLMLDLPGAACRLLSVCVVLDHPRVISTSRHITQVAIDLKSVKWDAKRKFLSGESEVVGGDPYTLTLAWPPTGLAYRMTKYSAQGAQAQAQNTGDVVTLTLDTPQSRLIKWQVAFETSARNEPAPAAPSDLNITMDGLDRAILKWAQSTSVPGEVRYQVARNGQQIAITSDCYYRDEELYLGVAYTYEIRAVNSAGRASGVVTASLRLPETKDAYLTGLHPTYVRQGYGTLQKDRSVVNVPMSIGSQKYEHGLGTMPGWSFPSRITYQINGNYARLEAEVGIDNSAQRHGTVTFEVWGDGKRLYDSGLVKGSEEPRNVAVDLSGIKTLELVVTNGGDGSFWDHADWANARLLVK